MQNKRQYKAHLLKYKINRIYTKPPNTKRNWFNLLVVLTRHVVTHLTNLVVHVSFSCSPLMSHFIQPLLIQVSYWEGVLIYKNDLRGHKVTWKQKHFHNVEWKAIRRVFKLILHCFGAERIVNKSFFQPWPLTKSNKNTPVWEKRLPLTMSWIMLIWIRHHDNLFFTKPGSLRQTTGITTYVILYVLNVCSVLNALKPPENTFYWKRYSGYKWKWIAVLHPS